MFVKILSSYNLKSVAIDELIGIEECALSAVLLRAERRSCKVNDFFKRLPFTKKTLAKFYDVNPVKRTPDGINPFRALESEIEVKAVDIECDSFLGFHDK